MDIVDDMHLAGGMLAIEGPAGSIWPNTLQL